MDKINKTPPHEIKLQAARKIVEQLIEIDCLSSDEADNAEEDIVKCASYHRDGFKIAKELEDRCYWECDSVMVEIFDGYESTLDRMRDEWLKETTQGIEPPFPIGTRVTWNGYEGEITGIYEYRPVSYLIKKDGDERAETHQSRSIVWFDQVQSA